MSAIENNANTGESNNSNAKDISLENNLPDNHITNMIGLTVDVKLNNCDDIITGLVFTIVKSNNLLILLRKDENETINSYVINIDNLNEIKISDERINVDFNELLTLNLDKIFENERKNLEKDNLLKKSEKDSDNLEAYKMYQKGLAIYEKLSKFYKCSYENNKISMDELEAFIEEPFNVENLKCENESTKKRLIRMIESCTK